ncbi:heparinase [Rhodobacterales bacterium HKCCE3408]|nr:heparinase [Rhodobacterales bacterium HKCCE3408]
MTDSGAAYGGAGFLSRAFDRRAAGAAARVRVSGFTAQPAPKAVGEAARGRQLLAGNFLFAGTLIEARGQSPWDITPPDAAFAAALHGFGWLDDLAAVGSPEARKTAQRWTGDWLARFGAGRGPGWTPALTGRRQIRWITHAIALMNGVDSETGSALIAGMGRQAGFLSRRWSAAPADLPRFEALVGYVHSATALSGFERHLDPALRALARDCEGRIDASGGIASRSPEALLEIFALLTWTAAILAETGRPQDPALTAAIARIAPTLRSLRHGDGSLARFHGGGRGRPGLLDHALRQSMLRPATATGAAMGFRRLTGDRVELIVDAAPPPTGRDATEAHASTLAFEMTSGRDPLIVSCGPGRHLGPDWQTAARATPSHSTLVLAGYSSARIGRRAQGELSEGPGRVEARAETAGAASALHLSHDGWRETHGLTHMRHLSLETDGRLLAGEDGLAALDDRDRDRLDRVLARVPGSSLDFAIRFHLHPDVEPRLDMGGQAVSLMLTSGELWVFRAQGGEPAKLALAPSVYLDSRHLSPRATKQIVLSARLTGYGSAVRWSLARPVDPPRRRGRTSRAPRLL